MVGSRRGWLAVVVGVWLGAALPAAAQATPDGPDATAVDEARQLFNEGIEFVEQEDWIQAEERFRRVLALRSSHVVAYNLASALVRLGRPVEAAGLLRSILRAGDADAATRDAAQQLLVETEPQIATLTIRVTGDMTGVRFALDDKPLELTAQVQTISVDPGEHTVTAYRGSTPLAFERAVTGAGAPLQAELAIELPMQITPEHAAARARRPQPESARRIAPVAPLAPSAEPEEESSGLGVWPWAAGGAVVAAAAVVAVVLFAGGGEADPVAGDTDPPFVRGHVR